MGLPKARRFLLGLRIMCGSTGRSRRRKRRLSLEPPLNPLNRSHQQHQQQQPQITRPILNPNIPKLPESCTQTAAPTIFTVNTVLAAQLRQAKYGSFLQLHGFINQAGIAANIITYNLLFQDYLDVKKPELALEHYKLFKDNAPLNPSVALFRILVKGLVEEAMEIKEEMCVKGFIADPVVYSYLMIGCAKGSDGEGVFKLYEELKEKLDMEEEATECYEEALGGESKVKMSAVGYTYVLGALSENGKFDEALNLFEVMKKEHKPPTRLALNVGSFNVMVNGYCGEGKFEEAMEVFRGMGEFRCSSPDTLSFNNMMNQLCENGLLAEAEKLYGEMDEKKVKPDEYTYGLLMDTCFKEGKIDEGAAYYKTMAESSLRPNLSLYNRLQNQLVKSGKLDDAKSFFGMMASKLKMDDEAYKFIMRAFKLRKEEREDDPQKLMDEKERLKAEAKARELEAEEAKKRSVVNNIASILPLKREEEKSEDDLG
ncbi:unnamed protein product [Brassica oleracea]